MSSLEVMTQIDKSCVVHLVLVLDCDAFWVQIGVNDSQLSMTVRDGRQETLDKLLQFVLFEGVALSHE